MKTLFLTSLLAAAFAATLVSAPVEAAGKTLQAFADEGELQRLLKRLELQAERSKKIAFAPPTPAPLPAPMTDATTLESTDSSSLDSIMVTGSRIEASDVITNVQTAGVDEGDIVKKRGDYLVVLRRGRLFTIHIGGDRLQPVSSVDAFAPGSDPDETWYDEMLVSDNTVVVIGYSNDRGGTEIGLFDLSAQGALRYRSTYQLRSSDYYSASNYASRLIGHTLIFYAPVELDYDQNGLDANLPALRRWHPGATPSDFKRILPAQRVYRSPDRLDYDDLALHTVSQCELGDGDMQCRSTAVLGPDSRNFYVSEDAVYVWTSRDDVRAGKPNASVFRLPLDGGAPSALRASGVPYDQLSFLQRDGWLNVLVGAQTDGEGMWSSRSHSGELALLRVRLDRFGDGREIARRTEYRRLPEVDFEQGDLHARYIGDWLVFGGGERWDDTPAPKQAHALRYAEAAARVQTLPLSHALQRVDALGGDAVLIGPEGEDLHFSSLRLDREARVAGHYVERKAQQGDDRTHGFFYQRSGDDQGLLGLPVLGEADDHETAKVLYLRNEALALSRLGALDARADPRIDDGCKVSCVDWYGNARPIFVGSRVFALLGYELVEGRLDGSRIRELRRSDFSPRAVIAH